MVARNSQEQLLAAASLILLITLTLAWIRLVESLNSEGDILYAFRGNLSDDPNNNVFQSWDQTLDTPCTWFHVSCNLQNHVISLDLPNSNLSGHLIPELGKLKDLQQLVLYDNNIQGSIPSELGNLNSLIRLYLYNNNLTGRIPSSLGKIKSLVSLRLNNNHLTGPIPIELTTSSTLKVFDVSGNNLSGTVPSHKNKQINLVSSSLRNQIYYHISSAILLYIFKEFGR